jgi:hypothetical protein
MRIVRHLVVIGLMVCGPLVFTGCKRSNEQTGGDAQGGNITELQMARVTTFCGACHAVPDPSSFPKAAWYAEVEQGFRFYEQSGRTDLVVPSRDDVVRWYRTSAPDELVLKVVDSSPSPILFLRSSIRLGTDIEGRRPGVSHIRAVSEGAHTDLFVCDMSLNGLFRIVATTDAQPTALLRLLDCQHPAHVEATDLDADGKTDYVIAILGSRLPGDHDKGQVIWLRPGNVVTDSVVTILLSDVGRVADVQAADIDGDDDLDLIVAEFGWRQSGRILLLRQIQLDSKPQFSTTVIDRRHGAIHVPVADLDHDGDLDFVALISQEHEEVAAFLNRGDGIFERQIIYLASDPSFGSSGIQLVDLDSDDDLDVLLSNGDTLDSEYLKPYHGVHWLENRNEFPYRCHNITLLPGVCRAIAGDLDNDGDLDIAAGAWIPHNIHSRPGTGSDEFETLIWLEQLENQRFERHVLHHMPSGGYMALELADTDNDGDQDIIAGRFATGFSSENEWVDLYENKGKSRRDRN